MKSTNQLGLPIDGGRWKPPYPEIDTTGSPGGKKLGETGPKWESNCAFQQTDTTQEQSSPLLLLQCSWISQ
jgi:hypothetical protein